ATAAEARAALREALDRLDEDLPLRDSRTTVAVWARRWIETSLEASSRRPSTKELYRGLMRNHVIARNLGRVPLDKLRPSHVDAWILELRGLTRTVARPGGKTEEVRVFADSSIT